MILQSEAGPSKPSKKRIVNYNSSDDNDDLPSPSPSPSKLKKPSAPNGVKKILGDGLTASTPEGTPMKKKRLSENGGREQSDKRKREADKLFATRRELPFYQGGFRRAD